MQREDEIRLRHMVDAIEAALRFARGRVRADLDHDQMLEFALVRAIEVIGEAASKLSAQARDGMPDIPWAAIVGARNRLIHAYFDINRDILWATIEKDLPGLLTSLRGHVFPA